MTSDFLTPVVIFVSIVGGGAKKYLCVQVLAQPTFL